MKWFNFFIMYHFNKRGILTFFWTVNDEKDMHDIILYSNAKAIMTDRPKVLKEIISFYMGGAPYGDKLK